MTADHVVNSARTVGIGSTPMPGPVGTRNRPSSKTNGYVMSVAK